MEKTIYSENGYEILLYNKLYSCPFCFSDKNIFLSYPDDVFKRSACLDCFFDDCVEDMLFVKHYGIGKINISLLNTFIFVLCMYKKMNENGGILIFEPIE